MVALIELRAINKYYKTGRESNHVLKDINLRIERGEFIAIVGPSGSGKTTLSQIIGGLAKPDSGEVLINGQQLNKRSDAALSLYRNRSIGFVLQQFSLLPDYTALENVALPLMLAKIAPSQRHQQAREQLRLVGLANKANQSVQHLSGGERQRVAIARALVMKPSILIADEPTGSLDSQRGEEIDALLHSLNQTRKVTVLLVTHNTELAKRAHRRLTIQNGQIIREANNAFA
jgi:ABC-type lipoprotein export system ATPase subunit